MLTKRPRPGSRPASSVMRSPQAREDGGGCRHSRRRAQQDGQHSGGSGPAPGGPSAPAPALACARGPALVRRQIPRSSRWDCGGLCQSHRWSPASTHQPGRPGSQVPHVPASHRPVLRAQFWESAPCPEASADSVLIGLLVDGVLNGPDFLQDLSEPQLDDPILPRPGRASRKLPREAGGPAVGHMKKGPWRSQDPGSHSATVLVSKVGIPAFQSLL